MDSGHNGPHLHPAMLMTTNPYVAFALTNQLIPPPASATSVLPGAALIGGAPGLLGPLGGMPHLDGLPGFSPASLMDPRLHVVGGGHHPGGPPPGNYGEPWTRRSGLDEDYRDFSSPGHPSRPNEDRHHERRSSSPRPRSPLGSNPGERRGAPGGSGINTWSTPWGRVPGEDAYVPRGGLPQMSSNFGQLHPSLDYDDLSDNGDGPRRGRERDANEESLWARRDRPLSRDRERSGNDSRDGRGRDRDVRDREKDRDWMDRRDRDNRRDRSRGRNRSRDRVRSRSRDKDRDRERKKRPSRWSDEDDGADRERPSRERDRGRERTRERGFDHADDEEEEGELRRDREDTSEGGADERRRRMRRDDAHGRRRSPDRDRDSRSREARRIFRAARILIRNVDRDMRDSKLEEEVRRAGAVPADVKVLRYRLVGADHSQGFGFVEFDAESDASAWLSKVQHRLTLSDGTECPMELLSGPSDSMSSDQLERVRRRVEWACGICRTRSGRRSDRCRSCYARREETEILDGVDMVSIGATGIILVRNLEPWTTEDYILRMLQSTSSLPIKKISLQTAVGGKTSSICRIQMYSTSDAGVLLRSLEDRDIVTPGGREPVFSFAKLPSSDMPSVAPTNAIDSAQWAAKAQQEQTQPQPDSSTDAMGGGEMPIYDPSNPEASLRQLAEYSASVYAQNPQELQYYVTYYLDYYRRQAASGALIDTQTQADAAFAAASAVRGAVAKAKLGALPDPKSAGRESSIDVGQIGQRGVKLPFPDTLKYVYDEASGYYLDPVTHLYYDSNTTYYYDAASSRFLYWDAEQQNYFPLSQQPSIPGAAGSGSEQVGTDKKDKAKVAKKIAKDMERWAKTMNQKKDTSKQGTAASAAQGPAASAISVSGPEAVPSSGAADAGFAVLQGRSAVSSGAPFRFAMSAHGKVGASSREVVAEPEDDDEDPSRGGFSDDDYTDWSKLACLLCKRQFPSREILTKHNLMSSLHLENIEKRKKLSAGSKRA